MKKAAKPVNLGKNIRMLRKQSGWTQIELAKKIKVSQALITAYENDVRVPPADKIAHMAELFGVNVNELFGARPQTSNAPVIKDRKLFKKFEQLQALPPHEKRTVLKMIDGLLAQKKS